MTKPIFSRLRGTGAPAALAAALLLAGCNPSGNVDRSQAANQLPALPATLPLAPGDVTPAANAPPANLLPAARPIRAVRVARPDDYYAYADNAWDFTEVLGDAPPDYGFDYGDVEPWAWQGYDNSILFLEPLGYGYRTYYYRPGADAPYFVRDPYYGYGYDNGQLAVVYGADGGVIPYADYGPRLDYASRYYVRGRDLYRASQQRRPVVGADWAAREQTIVAMRSRWSADRASQRDWQAYHQRSAPQQARYWDQEQARRRADSARFAAWRDDGFRAAPPPRAIPTAWKQARWARDDHRFAPPVAGFNGAPAARQRAVQQERQRVVLQPRPDLRPVPEAPDMRRVGMMRQQQFDQQQQQQRAFEARRADAARQQQAAFDQRRQGNPQGGRDRLQRLPPQPQVDRQAALQAQERGRRQMPQAQQQRFEAQRQQHVQAQQQAVVQHQQRLQAQQRQEIRAQQRQEMRVQQRDVQQQRQQVRMQERPRPQVQDRPQPQFRPSPPPRQVEARQWQRPQPQMRAEPQMRSAPSPHMAPPPRPAGPPPGPPPGQGNPGHGNPGHGNPQGNPGGGGDHKHDRH